MRGTTRSPVRRLFELWFGLAARVDRRAYAASSVALVALHYATDAAWVWSVTGGLWAPQAHLTPLLSTRTALLGTERAWLSWALFAGSLPFVWAGASLTFRRVLDAGLSAWTALFFFVPIVNWLWMLLLCVLPSRAPVAPPTAPLRTDASATHRLLAAAAPAAAVGLVAMSVSVLALGSYLAALFVGTPFAVGFVAGFLVHRDGDRGLRDTIVAGQVALLLASGAMLLFALEGLLCLAMAWPLAAPLAVLGGLLGRMVAGTHRLRPAQALGLLLALPLLMGAEAVGSGAPVREVVSAIEIAAPPDEVWPRVVGFSELPPPRRLVFALGIAYPMRARIEGEGVGAIRRCEFSTGAFVEPITVWERPRRLAFDVASQPEPMHETSPYRSVRAPHLVDGLRARRGEFRLVALPGGRTRLEGSTWYSVEMAPQAYWGLLSDQLIHAIHGRVLAHVKALAESDAAAAPDDGA